MSLEIVTETPGLWRDGNWTQGMPGVYALVVGVSAYPFLEGGETAGPETYGLGQLVTSATTAAKVFDWLRTSFFRENLPVVWCWLMLSPTAKEREAFEKDRLTHYCVPTYNNLRTAIEAWTGNVPTQPRASDLSRSFFFFSGHGVQSNRKAVLLPSNYLDNTLGASDVQKCIAVEDLKDWMEESPVAEHIALLDACRNEYSPLASKGASAYRLFPDNVSTSTGPRAAATLYATSPNAMAYQFEGLPYTFFGQAVLDALGGAAVSRNSNLEFSELFDYVKQRVNTLLIQQASQAPIEQSVRRSFEGDNDLVVTDFKPQSISVTSTAGEIPQMQFGALSSTPETSLYSQSRLCKALQLRFDDALEVQDCITFAALTDGSNGEARRRFGHEYASSAWVDGRAAIYSLEDGLPCPDGATILRVKRNEDSSIMQVDLALEPRRGGVLLVFQDSNFVERERLAMQLPTDSMERVPIRLSLTVGNVGAETLPKLQSIEGRLGPCDWNQNYNYLSTLFREADLGSLRKAAERADTVRLKKAAQQKRSAESAGTAGMLLLAEAGIIAKVGDWPRNLMEWFPLIPDGAVLWAQSLRDALAREEVQPYGVANPLEEMVAALEVACKRGMPFFADSLELAAGMIRHLRRADLTSVQRRRLDAVAKWIDRAMAVTVPAGHFLLVPGLPRPEGIMAGGPGAFTVAEILNLLHELN
jgi:hypothetical protein